MGKPADYVPACLPEKKKAPQLVWAILFGLSDNSIYGHHNARIKKMAPLCLSLTFFVAVRVWFATTEKKIVQKDTVHLFQIKNDSHLGDNSDSASLLSRTCKIACRHRYCTSIILASIDQQMGWQLC